MMKSKTSRSKMMNNGLDNYSSIAKIIQKIYLNIRKNDIKKKGGTIIDKKLEEEAKAYSNRWRKQVINALGLDTKNQGVQGKEACIAELCKKYGANAIKRGNEENTGGNQKHSYHIDIFYDLICQCLLLLPYYSYFTQDVRNYIVFGTDFPDNHQEDGIRKLLQENTRSDKALPLYHQVDMWQKTEKNEQKNNQTIELLAKFLEPLESGITLSDESYLAIKGEDDVKNSGDISYIHWLILHRRDYEARTELEKYEKACLEGKKILRILNQQFYWLRAISSHRIKEQEDFLAVRNKSIK